MGSSYFLCMLIALLIVVFVILSTAIRVVPEEKRLSVYRLGRFLGVRGPGLVLLIPIVDRGILMDVGEMEKTPSLRMAGVVGETRTTVYTDGKVFAAGEEWYAISQRPISAGQRVRVVRMVLEVEEE
jgi:membrane-bound ClpP family serine protease